MIVKVCANITFADIGIEAVIVCRDELVLSETNGLTLDGFV